MTFTQVNGGLVKILGPSAAIVVVVYLMTQLVMSMVNPAMRDESSTHIVINQEVATEIVNTLKTEKLILEEMLIQLREIRNTTGDTHKVLNSVTSNQVTNREFHQRMNELERGIITGGKRSVKPNE